MCFTAGLCSGVSLNVVYGDLRDLIKSYVFVSSLQLSVNYEFYFMLISRLREIKAMCDAPEPTPAPTALLTRVLLSETILSIRNMNPTHPIDKPARSTEG